ncbi:MAG: hypothetical protein K5905_06815 [Roseibium sp.]|uniref:hypothetical protein n=1 Tax=Roseibium sp. TaxID=1936156 RepID=UPI002603EF4C|nr:hypothetical protein [Roseibium sp.]MCV0425165.1 hypothetical protein [Roseibium sp.]
MNVVRTLSLIIVAHLGACASGDKSISIANYDIGAVETCEPGAVMEKLESDLKTGLAGSGAEKISGLYDVFFQVMRRCGKAQDLDFLVNQEWRDRRTARFLGYPDLLPYRYRMRTSQEGGLCLSREGVEAMLLNKPDWYCEKRGWTDKI